MARIVVHEETGPLKLTEADLDADKGNIAICQCGLSDEYPFCDGTHRQTRDETESVLYQYDVHDSETRMLVTGIATSDQPETE